MFTFHVTPRFSETDFLGHINNSAMPVWFEEARGPVFRMFNPELSIPAWNLILKKLDIEFDAQILLGCQVTIETSVVDIGTTSFKLFQLASQNGKQVASSREVLIHFNYETQRPEPIPAAIRARLEKSLSRP